MRQIIAIGGIGQPLTESGTDIYSYVLQQSVRPRPNICFVPTASAESRERIVQFFQVFSSLPCTPSWLSLFDLPTADLESFILAKDIIFVGGGNTRSMLALWREWNLDGILRKAYDRGIILAGSSAGANCWFEQCTTDSVPGELTILPCLGFLHGSFTPHYDVEPKRKPTLHRMLLSEEIQPGYAADNEAALHFVDGDLRRAVRTRESASAYQVQIKDARVIEQQLEMTLVGTK